MPLFQKKPRDKKGAPAVAPAWHPNFRNFDRLPDTKTVRTSFFINVAAGFVTLALLIWTVRGELTLRGLGAETEDKIASIAKAKAGSDAAVRLNARYQEEEKKLRELEQFAQGGVGGGKLVLSAFLAHLGTGRPAKVAFTDFDYKPAAVILRGSVSGNLVEAAGNVDEYKRQLQEDPAVATLFESVNNTGQSLDATGRLAFEITFKFKEPPKPAPPKEEKK